VQVSNQEIVKKTPVLMRHKLVLIVLLFIASVLIVPLKIIYLLLLQIKPAIIVWGSLIQICEGYTIS
jgi:hypothetical protein